MRDVARPELRAALGKPCPYCGHAMVPPDHPPSRDHAFTPRVRGGTLAPANRIIACVGCNTDKGAWSLPAFLAALEAEGDPRAAHVRTVLGIVTTGEFPQLGAEKYARAGR